MQNMSFKEFMKLEVGDGVIFDGYVGTVTDLDEVEKGKSNKDSNWYFVALHNMRVLEITYIDRALVLRKVYANIYVDYPDEVHNKAILSRMHVWDPFCMVGEGRCT